MFISGRYKSVAARPMMPITDFLSCADLIDNIDCFSHHQKHHAKSYVTGLIAGNNKVVRDPLEMGSPFQDRTVLNNFLIQYVEKIPSSTVSG